MAVGDSAVVVEEEAAPVVGEANDGSDCASKISAALLLFQSAAAW